MRYSTAFTSMHVVGGDTKTNTGTARLNAGVPFTFFFDNSFSSSDGYALDCWSLLVSDLNTRLIPRVTSRTQDNFTVVSTRDAVCYYIATGK